ncbi:MAG: hypothetical protein JOY64_35665 [Alphaproteobacteria bacterium]|nr:hypothetical protein [Alphaproteobacteria bacterium]
MSKLSALSRHESLVLERRLLRAIGRKPPIKSRLTEPTTATDTPRPKLAAAAAPARKLKEIGLRTVQ